MKAKDIFKHVKATSPSEADRKLALFIAEVEKGNYNNQSSITFTEMAQMFLDKYAKIIYLILLL